MSTAANPLRIILVGPRGAGKTTVARLLAARLGWDAADTDEWVERLAGRTVADILAIEGEPAFREREQAAVAAVLETAARIISVGGGAVVSMANRAALHSAGRVIWLQAPAETLCARLAADGRSVSLRPALTDLPPLEELRHLSAARAPFYTAVAHHVVDTAGRTPEQVAGAILALLSVAPPPEPA